MTFALNKNQEALKLSRQSRPQSRLKFDTVEYNLPKGFKFGPNFGSLIISSENPYSWNISLKNNFPRRRMIIVTRADCENRKVRQIYNLDGISTINSQANEASEFDAILSSILQAPNFLNPDDNQPAREETILRLTEIEITKDDYEDEGLEEGYHPPNCSI